MAAAERAQRRRMRQQDRLINRDFPWLWAIRSRWLLDFQIMWATNREDEIRGMLSQSFVADGEVWVRVRGGPSFTKVERIPRPENPSARIAEAIPLGAGDRVLNIVVVYRKSWEKKSIFAILRLPRGHASFDQMIIEEARAARSPTFLKIG